MEKSVWQKFTPWILFFLLFIFYLVGNNLSPIFIYDEARNTGCAREMLERGDWVVPTFNYELRTDKPPLHYWFMMFAYSIFGVTEFAARLFSALFGALTAVLIYWMAKRFCDYKTALFTVLVFASSLNLTFEFHLSVPDPYLIFFLTLAHCAFFIFYQNRKLAYLWLLYVATALAVLAKGPVALGFVGLNGLIWLLIKRDFKWKTIAAFRIWLGAIILALLILPWLISVGIATDWAWPKGFLFDHNINRFSGTMEGHGGLFLLTPAFVLLAFLPFILFIFQAYRNAFKSTKHNDLILFSLIVSLAVIVFFSISSTKLPNYPMPAYPFIALILGYYLAHAEIKRLPLLLTINFFIGVAIPAAGYIAISQMPWLLSITSLLYFLTLIPIATVAALVFAIMGKSNHMVLTTMASGWILVGILSYQFVLPEISSNEPATKAVALMDKKQPVAYYKSFNSSFPFYLQKKIIRLENEYEIERFFNLYPKGYLITTAKKAKEIDVTPYQQLISQKELFESPTTEVYYLPIALPEMLE